MSARTLIARTRTLVGSDSAYLGDDAVEVDQSVNYEVVRRRVFFDDVQLVTMHRERGLWFLLLTGAWGLLWTTVAIFIVAIDTNTWPAALIFLAVGAPAVIAFLLRLAMGRDVVTVFGRRSKASLKFGVFRHARAREAYGQICATVRRAQSRAARVEVTPAESDAPPLPPDVPPPPPAQ